MLFRREPAGESREGQGQGRPQQSHPLRHLQRIRVRPSQKAQTCGLPRWPFGHRVKSELVFGMAEPEFFEDVGEGEVRAHVRLLSWVRRRGLLRPSCLCLKSKLRLSPRESSTE